MKKTNLILVAIFSIVLAISIAAQTKAKMFRGYVSGTPIEMTLTRSGDKLSGSYLYTKIGKPLKLEGTINADGNFTLTETDANGKKTGMFAGKWSEDKNSNGATLDGDWNKPSAKDDKLGFVAYEQIVEFTGAAKITSQGLKESNKPKRFDITVEYPQIAGIDAAVAGKFNALAKLKAMNQVARFKKDMLAMTAADLKMMSPDTNSYLEVNYDIEWATDKLVSIHFINSEFSGGAHPNYESATLNFDSTNGKEIKLADLFEPKSAYLKTISEYAIADLKSRGEDLTDAETIESGAGAKPENYANWNLTNKGLMFTFDPYQVASYAAGMQTVIIPYDKLQSIMRKDVAAMLVKY